MDPSVSQLSSALQSMFSDCCDAAAEETGVIKRKRVFTASSLARTFVLALFENPTASAEEIAAMAAQCDAPVTKQAIEKRYSAATASFFESLFKRSTQLIAQADASLAPILDRFTAVILADKHIVTSNSVKPRSSVSPRRWKLRVSERLAYVGLCRSISTDVLSSTIKLPDSEAGSYKGTGGSHGVGKAALKLQTELDLKSGRLECVEVTSGCDSDVACDGQSRPRPEGTLRITDLGDFAAEVFADFAAAKCDFLTRMQRTMRVFIDGVDQGNIIDYLIGPKHTLIDRWIVVGTKNKLSCRLIAWKVPPKIAERRRRKVRADYKKRNRGTPPERALAACDWTMLVTNLTLEQLSVKEAVVLYRSRW